MKSQVSLLRLIEALNDLRASCDVLAGPQKGHRTRVFALSCWLSDSDMFYLTSFPCILLLYYLHLLLLKGGGSAGENKWRKQNETEVLSLVFLNSLSGKNDLPSSCTVYAYFIQVMNTSESCFLNASDSCFPNASESCEGEKLTESCRVNYPQNPFHSK